MVTNEVYKNEYDVIIIGGGATGAGTARDCALRGLKVLLVERNDYSTGATGRNHGLMHSGARYAVTDGESASECISENMILRRIARHCVEETDGLFITLPEDDLGYQRTFVDACQRAGISADVIDPDEARLIEPAVNPDLIGAVRIPDASIDPFRLTVANLLDARLHGAETLNYHEVEGMIVSQNRVEGVKLLNKRNGEHVEVRGRVVVNACGIWGQRIAAMAGVKISMFPARGALLIFGHRVNNMVINRCRKPANADILVPDDTVCVIGTTSDRIPIETVDDMRVTREEVDVLLKEGVKIAPSLATTRIIRAYAGVRPLTYRLMGEIATNAVCAKLGNTAPCVTATQPLPGSEEGAPDQSDMTKRYSFGQRAAIGRHGSLAARIEKDNDIDNALVCECEGVTVGEIKYAVHQLHVHNLVNLRRRTRVGMGTCQGKLCSCRAASLMGEFSHDVKGAQEDLAAFLDERWKGMRPVAWGDTLREAQLTAAIYEGLCGLDMAVDRTGKEDVQ